jgi:hypothetical protein
MHLNELKALHVSEVLKQADALEIENTGRMRKQELMFAIIKKRARAGEQVFADGVLEILPDGSDMRKAMLIFGSVLLAGLLVLVLLSEFAPARPRRFTGDLTQSLPEVSGWTRQEIPIAGSSAAMASAQGILNFSQVARTTERREIFAVCLLF